MSTRSTSYSHRQPNLPCGDLLGNEDAYNKICVPLYNASMRCDWEAASVILGEHHGIDLLGFAITENYDTALHIASSAKSSRSMEMFVEKLVNKMTKEQLELQNKSYNTALCLAAADSAGNVNIAMTMVEKNRALLDIPAREGLMPLSIASRSGQRNMVQLFYDNSNKMTGEFWTDQNRSQVLHNCVEVDLFDVSLKIVTDWPTLTANKELLGLLARRTEAFGLIKPPFFRRALHKICAVIWMKIGPAEKPSDAMQLLRIICGNIMKLPKAKTDDLMGNVTNERGLPTHSLQPLFIAAEMGNTEFVVELIRQYPDLLWKRNDDNQTIFHVAVLHRHVSIYNLLHEIGSMKDMITSVVDKNGNNMLHLVGMVANGHEREDNSGVRLQMQHMQREVLWFKEVKDMIPPSYRKMKNKNDRTPKQLFKSEHDYLLLANEKWMKDTANQCLLIAALIASTGCSAAFAVPGGYNQNTGMPIFLHNRPFIFFNILNAISVVFAAYSILIFLSIFISRYTEHNFLESLPKKLMRGLSALFFSVANMAVAFLVAFFSFWQGELIWVPLFISCFIFMPVILYVRLQYEVLMDVYYSTYGSRNLFRPKKLRLYHQNPRL
ncbi:hypothetical protein Lser_V15G28435 [Lactuca serriola]